MIRKSRKDFYINFKLTQDIFLLIYLDIFHLFFHKYLSKKVFTLTVFNAPSFKATTFQSTKIQRTLFFYALKILTCAPEFEHMLLSNDNPREPILCGYFWNGTHVEFPSVDVERHLGIQDPIQYGYF